MNPLVLVRHLAGRWMGAISEASPLSSRYTDEALVDAFLAAPIALEHALS